MPVSGKSSTDAVDIGDVLRWALPLNTAVVNAPGHFRHPARWAVTLSSWRALAEQVEAGDLVLVPPSLQRQATETLLKKKLEALARRAVCGLILFAPLGDGLIQDVETLELPLLLAPPGTSVRETYKDVIALLMDRNVATSERGSQLYRKLSEMSREGHGLAKMTDVMANLTGKLIVVQDKRLEVQAMSSPRTADFDWEEIGPVLGRRDQLPSVLRNRKAAAKARQSYWQQLLPIENTGRIISPIVSGDRARGYLSVVGPASELDLLDSLAAEHGAAACALEMAKAKAVSEVRKALRGDFLEGLLAETLPPQEIDRLAARLDHDTSSPHAVMTFATDTPAILSLRRLETTVNWLLTNHNRTALVHTQGDRHISVFHALRDVDDMESAHAFARRIQEQITADIPDACVIGGMSGPAEKLTDWPGIYQEALQSMQLGRRLRLKTVVEFGSLGVYRLLANLEHFPTVRAFTERIIGPLVAYDREHGSSLVQTIDAYFSHHGNISQTAESLFIHRNTLLYRLDRIQELTKQDLSQANMRLALQLALKFWQLNPDR